MVRRCAYGRAGVPKRCTNSRREKEAQSRAAIVAEAFSWVGTPFINCADVKGRQGGVDCAMLATRCYVDTGRLEPFDPRPYPPGFMLHSAEERFLEFITARLGAHEIDSPKLADVPVWQFGRCFSHCGIIVNSNEVVHAYRHSGFVILSRRDEPLLKTLSNGAARPVKFFSVWGSDG
jgi:cell wall-associated NlpC family hydrolase